MTEYKQLKEIIDLIGYENKNITFEININSKKLICYKYNNIADVREIIFTQEFMDKFIKYVKENDLDIKKGDYMNGWINHLKMKIIDNLNNPVEYLYNLIK